MIYCFYDHPKKLFSFLGMIGFLISSSPRNPLNEHRSILDLIITMHKSFSFIFVLFHSNYNFNTTNYIKYGWCARDFNPWPQNRRNRHNLGTMAAANFTYANKKGKIYRIFNTSY